MYAPQHDDGVVRDAEVTDEPVLTCFTCVGFTFVDSPSRDLFDDVDEDGTSYQDDDD